jgi:glycosyltransferase involved in cell wall biosynthesis
MTATPTATIVTFSKGRKHHLEQSLPAMLNQVGAGEHCVVVVDYGCPNGTTEWCQRACGHDPRLLIVRHHPETAELNRSHARNIGAVAAPASDFLAFVDADALLMPGWLRHNIEMLHGQTTAIIAPNWNPKTDKKQKGVGCCVVPFAVFHAARGYDESLTGWGWEDSDFWQRCQRHGSAAYSDGRLIRILRHGQKERVRFHDQKNPSRSKQANIERTVNRETIVNPAGYAGGNWRIVGSGTSHVAL